MSRIDRIHPHEKAELILERFKRILHNDTNLAKFNATLPSPRVLLLLLGASPSSITASHILDLVGLHLVAFSNFARKLELAQFWSVLKVVLPKTWDRNVHVAAFNLLLGRSFPYDLAPEDPPSAVVKFPSILPVIIACLEYGLFKIVERTFYVGEGLQVQQRSKCKEKIWLIGAILT